jgi:hypothetical protein
MKVGILCEFSGIVRDAFIARGHDAISCDILRTDNPGPHHVGDAIEFATSNSFDLIIAHPPCTYLANSGAKHLYKNCNKYDGINAERWDAMEQASIFFRQILELNTPRLCVENPIIHCHAAERIGRRQDQIIQPWQFGHGETKATCLWLKGLPKLKPSNIVSGRTPRVHYASPSPDRWKERSKTLSGIADAMAEQWGAN